MSDPYRDAEIGGIIDMLDQDTVRVELHAGTGDQDELDGAALRRLREAAKNHGAAAVTFRMYSSGHDFTAWVSDSDITPFPTGEAPTIAEAADKCRETLG